MIDERTELSPHDVEFGKYKLHTEEVLACVPISTWVLLLPGKQGDLPEDKIAKIWKDWFNNSSLEV